MSVSSEDNKISYVANGSATYPIPFYFTDKEHIKLYVDEEELALDSDYSVTGENDPSGGELTLLGVPYNNDEVVLILREVPVTQEDTLTEGGPNSAKANERRFDKLTLIAQQLKEQITRAIKFPLASTFNSQILGEVTPGAVIQVNPAGDGLEMGMSLDTFSTQMDEKVAQAEAARDSAFEYNNNADVAADWAQADRILAEEAKTAAETAETQAEAHRLAAESARAACELALNSVGWQDTLPVNSNTVLDETYNGCMILVDCSLGPVQITLPPISNLDLDFPFSIGIKKSDSSGNSINIVRAGTDLIDGATSKTIGTAGSGAVFIPDEDPSPNLWSTAEFGASAGNMTVDTFAGDGSDTTFTLSVDPGSRNNTDVIIDGVHQHKSTYTILGTTLTFSEAPYSGATIEVKSGTTLPTGVPSDGTVTLSKLAQEVLNSLIPVGTPIWNISPDEIPGYVSAMNKTIGLSGANYSGTAYYALYAKVWAMAGVSTTAGDPFRISSAKGASAAADWAAGKLITLDFETNEVYIRAKGSSRNAGSYQEDAMQGHYHSATYGNTGGSAVNTRISISANSGATATSNGMVTGPITDSVNGTPRTANETRTKNTALYAFIKY